MTSTPVAFSKARIFRPSRPMIRPFMSSAGRGTIDTVVSATTDENVPVEIALSASDADGNSLSYRVVSQPANGTVGLTGAVATFYPFAGFSGSDSFTYAAWDGSTNSNLGTGRVTVSDGGGGGGTCTVNCSASVDATGTVGISVSFSGAAVLSDCAGAATYDWDFGDGSTASGSDTSHTYGTPGTYDWSLTVTTDGVSCTRTGSVEIAPEVTTCSLECDTEVPQSAQAGRKVELHGDVESESCGGRPTYEWNFGDGSDLGRGDEVEHRWQEAGSYVWRLRVIQDGAVCEASDTIVILDGTDTHHSSGRRRPH